MGKLAKSLLSIWFKGEAYPLIFIIVVLCVGKTHATHPNTQRIINNVF
jgi:hypothetical protein